MYRLEKLYQLDLYLEVKENNTLVRECLKLKERNIEKYKLT